MKSFIKYTNIRLKKPQRIVYIIYFCITLPLLSISLNLDYATAISGGQAIANKAIELAWPDDGTNHDEDIKPEYAQAAKDNGTPELAQTSDKSALHCGHFVSTVVLASGVDSGFPKGLSAQTNIIKKHFAESNLWKEVNKPDSEDSLQPGDIFIDAKENSAIPSGYEQGHILIYVGNGKFAEASYLRYTGKILTKKDSYWKNDRFILYRYAGSSNNFSDSNSSSSYNLTAGNAAMFSQNDIIGWNPNECEDKGDKKSSGACGNSAKEIYWTTLQKYFDDPIKIAGIIGNLANEGGMNPTAWEGGPNDCEGGGINSSGSLISGWNFYYDGISTCTGVGAFGITSQLSKYLHTINDESTGLIEYFKDTTSYSFNFLYHPGCSIDSEHTAYGDCLLEKIGGAEFSKLVEFEVKYAIEDFNPSQTQAYMEASFSTPSDAAVWWMDNWERPASRNPVERGQDAEKAYEELKDFVCTGGFSSSDITLIGDSISMYASSELNSKFPNSFLNMVGTRHTTKGGDCSSDGGGIDTLEKIVSGSGTLPQQNGKGSSCGSLTIDNSSLKSNIVWQLGTNPDGANENNLKKILNSIGTSRKLFLVTPYTPTNLDGGYITISKMNEIAELYRNFAKKHDNVYVADWANAVKNNYSKYLVKEDALYVHPSEDGKQLLADLIATAVENANGGSSDSSGSGGTPSSTDNPSSSPGSGSSDTASSPDITLIGDSISVQAEQELEKTFPDSFLDKVGSRHPTSAGACSGDEGGLSIVKKIISGSGSIVDQHWTGDCSTITIDSSSLKKNIVWELGTNSVGATKETIDELINAVGSDYNLYLVTPYNGLDVSSSDSIAQIYRDAADKHDNVYIVDWAAKVKDNESTYITRADSMAVHPTDEGKKLLAQMIYDAVSGSSDCVINEDDYPHYPQKTGVTCGAASVAMLATVATGKDISEDDVVAATGGDINSYPDTSGLGAAALTQKVGEKYGFDVEGVDTNGLSYTEVADKMKEYFSKGYMIHMSGEGCTISSTCGDHYVGMFAMKNDEVFLADSSRPNRWVNLVDYVSSGYHGGAFTAIKGNGNNYCNNKSGGDDYCPEDGGNSDNSGINSGGFTSLEEAEEKIVKPYRELLAKDDPADHAKYHTPTFTDGTQTFDNCFSFSNYFITRYTTIDFSYVSGDGGGYAENFYNEYHDRYPDLKLSTEPTAYSVAGCGDKVYTPGSYSHTFIVLGVNKSKGTMIYAEAGLGTGATSANEISLTDTAWGKYNGSTGICHYTDFSKYIKGL